MRNAAPGGKIRLRLRYEASVIFLFDTHKDVEIRSGCFFEAGVVCGHGVRMTRVARAVYKDLL